MCVWMCMNKWQDSSFSLKWTCVLSYLGELAIMKHDYRHEHGWDMDTETDTGHKNSQHGDTLVFVLE